MSRLAWFSLGGVFGSGGYLSDMTYHVILRWGPVGMLSYAMPLLLTGIGVAFLILGRTEWRRRLHKAPPTTIGYLVAGVVIGRVAGWLLSHLVDCCG